MLACNTKPIRPPPHVTVAAVARAMIVISFSAAIIAFHPTENAARIAELALRADYIEARITLGEPVGLEVCRAPLLPVVNLAE